MLEKIYNNSYLDIFKVPSAQASCKYFVWQMRAFSDPPFYHAPMPQALFNSTPDRPPVIFARCYL